MSGRLLEAGSQRPILLGRVALLDSALTIVELTYSDHEGKFVLRAPMAGSYWIAADRLGYLPLVDGIIEFEEGGFLPVVVYIRPRPIELEGITATVPRREIERNLIQNGFYERQASGFGYFITPDEIEQRAPSDVPELLRRIPGPAFDHGGVHGAIPLFRSRGRTPPPEEEDQNPLPPGYCYPQIYVDGQLIYSHEIPPGRYRPRIEDLVAIHDIAAVEVYSGGATAPLQWGGSWGNCGVIVFWTKRGAG